MAKNGNIFFITDHYKNSLGMLVDLYQVSNNDLETPVKGRLAAKASFNWYETRPSETPV
jgi:hypothetical protein